jgi:hypothetical protein
MHIRWDALLLAAGVLLLPHPAAAQPTPAAPTNDDCLTCHGDAGAVRGDGSSVAVKPETFGASVHGAVGLACVDCHADLAKATEFPHAEALAAVSCATCHDAAVTQYATSIHAQARAAGEAEAASCVDCHGTHDIRQKADVASRTHHLNVPEMCGRCHGPKGRHAPAVFAQFEDSIHGRALLAKGLVVAPNCASCHTAHEVRKKSDPASHVFRTNVIGTCTTCHEGIKPVYERSIHAQAVKAGNALAPVCSDCHTAHGIAATDTSDWQLQIVRECGTCHEQSLRTYRDTFHGKVTELGFTRVAKCADCHGAHDVLPASNPLSAVSPANRAATCQKCHPGANENFAKYDPHADPHNATRNPALAYASRFMQVLLGGVFVFFGIHTLLWFPRSWQVRRDRRRPGGGSSGREA